MNNFINNWVAPFLFGAIVAILFVVVLFFPIK